MTTVSSRETSIMLETTASVAEDTGNNLRNAFIVAARLFKLTYRTGASFVV